MSAGAESADRQSRARLVAGILLAVHAGMLGWGAWRHSPCYDELEHLVAGISHWELGRFDLYRVNPPLVRLVAAIPAVLGGVEVNYDRYDSAPGQRSETAVRTDFVQAHGRDVFRFVTQARWAVIPLSLVGGWFVLRWASDLGGQTAGCLALGLWCASPNILAHGQLITPDLGATAMGLGAAYAFRCWALRPTWRSAAGAATGLGLALAAKTTWMLLLGLWPMLWLATRDWRLRTTSLAAETLQLLLILAAGIGIVNAFYAGEDTGRRLSDFQFASGALGGRDVPPGEQSPILANRFPGSLAGRLRVPLPANYVLGADIQKWDFERGKLSYLDGQWRHGGWWYYYLVGLAVKVPLGTWLLVLIAVAAAAGRVPWRELAWLLAPAAAVVILVSSQTGFNHHLRYVLPALGFVFVLGGQAWALVPRADRVLRTAVGAALVWSVASSLWVFPHSLSYFNELAGGPRHGIQVLGAPAADSNLDWGQDLLYLERWLEQHPGVRLSGLALNAPYSPRDVGIDVPPPPARARPGWYAVSVSRLWSEGRYAYLRERSPAAMAGYSIWIFHIEDSTRGE